jgi:hypothetical protein
MQLKKREEQFFELEGENKFLVVAFKNNKLDSIGGYCKAKDFHSQGKDKGFGDKSNSKNKLMVAPKGLPSLDIFKVRD